MQKFSQKWSIVAFLEPIKEGTAFFYKNWPLHITLSSVFATTRNGEELIAVLENLLKNQRSLPLTTTGEARWGNESQIHVMLLEKTTELLNLHNTLHHALGLVGAEFNEPQYEGDGYIPHSTVQRNNKLVIGEQVVIDNLALIDMFPNADGHQRKVAKIISFS